MEFCFLAFIFQEAVQNIILLRPLLISSNLVGIINTIKKKLLEGDKLIGRPCD